jgi:ATP-dependent Lon protease
MASKRKIPYDPLESLLTSLPERIPVMPVKSTVVFPTGATGLQVSFPPNIEVLSLNPGKSLVVALVTTDDEDDPIDPATLEKVGVLTRVLNRLHLPGGLIQATVQGLIRIHLDSVRFENNHFTAFPRLVKEMPVTEAEADTLIEPILATLNGIGARVERLADVPRILRRNIGDPGRFADLVATLAHFNVEDRDEVLQRLDVAERLKYAQQVLDGEWERLQELEQQEAAAEAGEKPAASPPRPIRRGERTAEIRKQIASLQAELGEMDPAERETIELLRRIERSQLPPRVASIARREAERMRNVVPSSTDSTEIHSYLDAVLELPWGCMSDGGTIDLDAVREALDERHLNLDEVKRRILEFLSVAKLRGGLVGPIPCLVGPPGVGKRSLATAVARGLGRPMVRVELGGRGEAQLVGARRSRTGAQSGKLIGAYRDAEVCDPVFLLEEIDEIGLGNVEGDPVEALEEFLDPTLRTEFVDRYIDIPFDLSETVFIATANDFYRIPRSLREFLIEIRISGRTPEEKVEIAKRSMLPRLVEEHGLSEGDVTADEEALTFLTRGYARDSGLGNLRRALSSILRFVALRKAQGMECPIALTPALIEEVLGVPRYPNTEAESAPEVGVVTGLAWTASGGELMFIEALKMPGTGRLITTGLLGEVMRESVSAAFSYVRSRAELLGIAPEVFTDSDVHVHFPVGATPKDGPSAGAAITLAIASSLSERPVRHDIAMTGEVTLRGRILEIGGLKEKILAAYRANIRQVLLPAGNERDLRDVPEDVREAMTFHLVDRMDEVLELCLLEKIEEGPRRRGRAAGGRERGRRAAGSTKETSTKEEAEE